MSEEILVNITPQETRIAFVQEGVVQELHTERTLTRGLAGNVYLGKVVRVLPGMQSAFIDIGLERAAFLHVADIWEANAPRTAAEPIEKMLHDGQVIMVRVVKDPMGNKGARLSTQISLAGRMLVYLPQDTHIGISQKIGQEADREKLRQRMQELLSADEKGGCIVRTLAEEATDEELKADIDYLQKIWRNMREKARTEPAPSLLYEDLNLSERVLRDYMRDHTTLLVDSRKAYQQLRTFSERYTPDVVDRIQLYSGDRHLFDFYVVEEEIQRALRRRVDLKSGGYLMIDQTEAMTTIDVNTGGFVGVRNFDDTIFKTNLEAAQAIARQLRLRNLGGIIILDFIDMESQEHRDAVLAELKKILAQDRVKTTVSGFSALGLVEMTRKRTRESLSQLMCESCPTCHNSGHVKTARTICYEILREVMRESRQFNPREFRVVASKWVIEMFSEEESQSLAVLGDFIKKPISLQIEPSYAQDQYDVILL